MKRLATIIVSTSLLASAPHVRADTRAAMHDYFDGERRSGWLWGSVGLTAIGAGTILVTRKSELAQGVAYPMLAIGAVQTLAGVFLLLGTNGRIRDNDAKISANEAAFRDDELARIKRTNTTFLILEIVEAALIAGGTTLAIVSHGKSDKWTGVGIGLAVQGALMLGLDALASRRAHQYQDTLERITVGVSGNTLTLSGSF